MMKEIKAVAFDMEGTVIDVEYAHHQAHIDSAKDAGIIISLEDCFKKLPHFIGGPDDEVAKEVAQLAYAQTGKKVDYADVFESKKRHYERLIKELPIEPRKGFLDFFYAIENMGLRYSIGSLTRKADAMTLLERGGLDKLFGYPNIVLREHVKKVKPAPDVWIETAKRMSVEPRDQVVFEDSPRGIAGAVEVGAYCIGMPTYNRPDVVSALANAGAKKIFLQWDEINAYSLMQNINKERS